MRTLDKSYLNTHPVGVEKAQFQLSVSVRSNIEIAPNPDGSRPKVFIDVVADTYMAALSVLTEMHDTQWESALTPMLLEIYSDEELAAFNNEEPAGEEFEALKARISEIATPSRVTTFPVTMTEEYEDGSTTESEVEITITYPSIEAALGAAVHLTSNRMLQTAAISFCPETDDYDDDDWGHDCNEVLVRD